MKEQQLDPQQSIELISRMIRNTRNRLERHTGRPFLIWGYTTVGITLFNYLVRMERMNPFWQFTWFLIPVIGCLLMRLIPSKKQSEPRTEIDRIISKVWLVASIALIPAFIFNMFYGLNFCAELFSLITLLMGIGTASTGLIVRSKIYSIAGFFGMASSTLFIFYDFYLRDLPAEQINEITGDRIYQLPIPMLIFAAIFTVMMIIPGHIMQYKSRKQCSKS